MEPSRPLFPDEPYSVDVKWADQYRFMLSTSITCKGCHKDIVLSGEVDSCKCGKEYSIYPVHVEEVGKTDAEA